MKVITMKIKIIIMLMCLNIGAMEQQQKELIQHLHSSRNTNGMNSATTLLLAGITFHESRVTQKPWMFWFSISLLGMSLGSGVDSYQSHRLMQKLKK